jgi:hypothetical protein
LVTPTAPRSILLQPLVLQPDGKTYEFEDEYRNLLKLRGEPGLLLLKGSMAQSDRMIHCYFNLANTSQREIE